MSIKLATIAKTLSVVNDDMHEQIGISLLCVGCSVSVWAATNSSIYALRNFTKTAENIENARKGMNIGLFLVGIVSLGIILGYGKKGIIPGTLTLLTGVGFYIYYDRTLKELSEKMSLAEIIPQSVTQTPQLTQPAELQTLGIETKAVVAMPGSPYSSLMNWRKKYLRR